MTTVASQRGLNLANVFGMDGAPIQSPLGYPSTGTQFAPYNTGNEPDTPLNDWWMVNEPPEPTTNANETRTSNQQIIQVVIFAALVAGAVAIFKWM